MNLSGILVVAASGRLAEMVDAINALPGAEVHYQDPEKGRIVVVQEAATIDEEVDGLKRIQALPHIAMAELVYHYFEEDTAPVDAVPELVADAPGLDTGRIPAFLVD